MVIFLEREDSRGDHGLGRLVEFRFKAPPSTTSSSVTTHTPSGQRNCASWASQPQKLVTPAMPRREDHEVHKGHVVALDQKKKKHIYIGVRLRFESSCIRINTVFCAMTQLRTLDGRYKMCVRNKGGDIFVEEGSSELY